MVSAAFIILASICKALADTILFHFDTSVFKRKRQVFWNPAVSSTEAPRIFKYKIDAWHIANSLQICSWAALPFVYEPVFGSWLLNYAAIGILFIVVFNLFYNKLFR